MDRLTIYWQDAMNTRCSYSTLKEMKKNVDAALRKNKEQKTLSQSTVRELKRLRKYLDVRMSKYSQLFVRNYWGV